MAADIAEWLPPLFFIKLIMVSSSTPSGAISRNFEEHSDKVVNDVKKIANFCQTEFHKGSGVTFRKSSPLGFVIGSADDRRYFKVDEAYARGNPSDGGQSQFPRANDRGGDFCTHVECYKLGHPPDRSSRPFLILERSEVKPNRFTLRGFAQQGRV